MQATSSADRVVPGKKQTAEVPGHVTPRPTETERDLCAGDRERLVRWETSGGHLSPEHVDIWETSQEQQPAAQLPQKLTFKTKSILLS